METLVSGIQGMYAMFCGSRFNDDISLWDTSNVKNMGFMFSQSYFNNDISKWDVSKVTDMSYMFHQSQFNGDIGQWNVNNVIDMEHMFDFAAFSGDISQWVPLKLKSNQSMFKNSDASIPYWGEYSDMENRIKAIEKFQLNKELGKELIGNDSQKKKVKI
jgi:surface protein